MQGYPEPQQGNHAGFRFSRLTVPDTGSVRIRRVGQSDAHFKLEASLLGGTVVKCHRAQGKENPLRKEVILMRYERPQIHLLDQAAHAIQATQKASATTPDSKNNPDKVTISAYEADE